MAERKVEIADFTDFGNLKAALHVYIVTFKFGTGQLGVASLGLSRVLSGLEDVLALEYFLFKQEFVLVGGEKLKPTSLLCFQEVEKEEVKAQVKIDGQYYHVYSHSQEFTDRMKRWYEKR